ncbi:hypothetical protein NX059_005802 [Plenodomus lindquistii]|nr:hypothetical protein NX059_005802 [Plenodomus lindquistii]
MDTDIDIDADASHRSSSTPLACIHHCYLVDSSLGIVCTGCYCIALHYTRPTHRPWATDAGCASGASLDDTSPASACVPTFHSPVWKFRATPRDATRMREKQASRVVARPSSLLPLGQK